MPWLPFVNFKVKAIRTQNWKDWVTDLDVPLSVVTVCDLGADGRCRAAWRAVPRLGAPDPHAEMLDCRCLMCEPRFGEASRSETKYWPFERHCSF
jgi:hypothetical protein